MLLAVDIGNTTTNFGLVDGKKLIRTFKVFTEKKRGDAQHFGLVQKELKKLKIRGKIDAAIIASVVPTATPLLVDFIKKYFSVNSLLVNGNMNLPIGLAGSRKKEAGADLIADVSAASILYKKPLIVVDSGTATTCNVLSKENQFTEVIIAPGLELFAKSLSENAALLPKIPFEKPKAFRGTNTIEAMQSGIYWGYVGMIREILSKLKKKYRVKSIIGTGGNIEKVYDDLPVINILDHELTLKGLQILYDLNR